MDLIIGNVNGVLHYYHKEEGSYVLVSSGWGGVDVRRPGDLVGHSAPFMFRNESGLMQLVVGSASGHIFCMTRSKKVCWANFMNVTPSSSESCPVCSAPFQELTSIMMVNRSLL